MAQSTVFGDNPAACQAWPKALNGAPVDLNGAFEGDL
jgi:hypothetical protein